MPVPCARHALGSALRHGVSCDTIARLQPTYVVGRRDAPLIPRSKSSVLARPRGRRRRRRPGGRCASAREGFFHEGREMWIATVAPRGVFGGPPPHREEALRMLRVTRPGWQTLVEC